MKMLAWAALALSALLACAPATAQDTNTAPAAGVGVMTGFASTWTKNIGGVLHQFWASPDTPFPTTGTVSCTVVAGDQSFAAGSPAICTMTQTGRVKVDLSSQAVLGATASMIGDLSATIDPSGNQQALQSDAAKNLKVIQPQPAAFAAVQLALAANARAQLATQLTGMTNGVVCKQIGGSVDVLVGGSTVSTAEDGTGNGYPIEPGGAWSSGITSTAGVYFVASAAAVISCAGN